MTKDDLMQKADKALESAKVLLDAQDPDGACNRAYYAMFDVARAALLAEGVESGKTHKGILSLFSEYFVRNGSVSKEIGRTLKRAETIRYVADYNGDSVALEEARKLVDEADEFVNAVSAYI